MNIDSKLYNILIQPNRLAIQFEKKLSFICNRIFSTVAAFIVFIND